jgi:hypothetical protein
MNRLSVLPSVVNGNNATSSLQSQKAPPHLPHGSLLEWHLRRIGVKDVEKARREAETGMRKREAQDRLKNAQLNPEGGHERRGRAAPEQARPVDGDAGAPPFGNRYTRPLWRPTSARWPVGSKAWTVHASPEEKAELKAQQNQGAAGCGGDTASLLAALRPAVARMVREQLRQDLPELAPPLVRGEMTRQLRDLIPHLPRLLEAARRRGTPPHSNEPKRGRP